MLYEKQQPNNLGGFVILLEDSVTTTIMCGIANRNVFNFDYWEIKRY